MPATVCFVSVGLDPGGVADGETRSLGLGEAFGFQERVRIGEAHRSQIRVGEGAVIVADVRKQQVPPRPGEITHRVMVRVDDVRAHCERARAHGARIVMEPTDFEYGERQYSAADPAGYVWTFSESVADVDPAELATVTESRLVLWKNIGGVWTPQGGTPDVAGNFVTHTGVSSPARYIRTSFTASRRSVLIRSPGLRGTNAGAITTQAMPIFESCR